MSRIPGELRHFPTESSRSPPRCWCGPETTGFGTALLAGNFSSMAGLRQFSAQLFIHRHHVDQSPPALLPHSPSDDSLMVVNRLLLLGVVWIPLRHALMAQAMESGHRARPRFSTTPPTWRLRCFSICCLGYCVQTGPCGSHLLRKCGASPGVMRPESSDVLCFCFAATWWNVKVSLTINPTAWHCIFSCHRTLAKAPKPLITTHLIRPVSYSPLGGGDNASQVRS